MALLPVGTLCGAKIVDPAGEAVGAIAELMLDAETGAVAYAVLAAGGVAGIGEKLFALPWAALRHDGETVTVNAPKSRFDADPGFDKDAWPTEADASLA